MSERAATGSSVFEKVDQAAMLERLADSPLDDAEVGLLSDCDSSGVRLTSESLLDGIRIFSGEWGQGTPTPTVATGANPFRSVRNEETFVARVMPTPTRESFILFGPAGPGTHAGAA